MKTLVLIGLTLGVLSQSQLAHAFLSCEGPVTITSCGPELSASTQSYSPPRIPAGRLLDYIAGVNDAYKNCAGYCKSGSLNIPVSCKLSWDEYYYHLDVDGRDGGFVRQTDGSVFESCAEYY